jgi:hypothetical protein
MFLVNIYLDFFLSLGPIQGETLSSIARCMGKEPKMPSVPGNP